MDIYTREMKNSDSLNKINVRFKSCRDYLYSGWEINQISNSLNNVYYKNELINTLKSLLVNETNPKDIYILNSSVKVGQEYNLIKDGHLDLNKSKGIINLYYMGSPIPLIPDEDTWKINYIFEIFRSYYKKCNSLGLNSPKRRYTIHNLFANRDKITNAAWLKEYLNKRTYECNPLLEAKELDEKVLKVFKTLENSFKAFDSMFKDFKLIDSFNEKYSNNVGEGLNTEKYNAVTKYFNYFQNTFNKLDRPIICVHNRQENRLDILCTDLIAVKNFTEDNYRFFETKNISQNSPLIIAIGIGIGLAPSIFKVGESLLSARKTLVNAKKEALKLIEEMDDLDEALDEYDEELEVLKREIQDLDTEIQQIEDNTTENEVVNKAKNVISNYIPFNEILDGYAIGIVNSLDEKNNENFAQTLEEKDLTIDNVVERNTEAS
ncbi:hypothetical protein [Bacillus mycoides]|uniref:hypothetical protein n=1 Tax=Bacillus mycoides TaxID=1405 RepID=UPI001C01E361|nr:hypothetical protein [Bacillus mycoides]QWH95539.1 hypothetical protein EXW36_02760 [Bacillus mycoides]